MPSKKISGGKFNNKVYDSVDFVVPKGYITDDIGELVYVGDRFYQQQLAAVGSCPGREKSSKPKQPTKADILGSLPAALSKLTKADLQLVAAAWPDRRGIDVPTGRLKAPYIKALRESVHADADWNKLTVKDMTEVLLHTSKPS